MVLMCKNKPVFDVRNNAVIDAALAPGAMLNGMSFRDWARHRRSVLSNTIARKTYFQAFGYGTEDEADRRTHMFSLSDCYWLKYDGEEVLFEDVSPYHARFWDGSGSYEHGAIPTIYTPGAVGKCWLDSKRLYKKGCFVEMEAYMLAVALGIPCNKVEASADGDGIVAYNITTSDAMLEPAICSGRFAGDFFPTIAEIIDSFGDDGIKMLAFDAVIGNTDRHLENFGFLRDANTGEYLGMAPLFDFDQALSADGTDDFLITQLPRHNLIERICNRVLRESGQPLFRARAIAILDNLFH